MNRREDTKQANVTIHNDRQKVPWKIKNNTEAVHIFSSCFCRLLWKTFLSYNEHRILQATEKVKTSNNHGDHREKLSLLLGRCFLNSKTQQLIRIFSKEKKKQPCKLMKKQQGNYQNTSYFSKRIRKTLEII